MGKKRRLVAEVPFADALCGVAERPEAVGDGVLLRMQPVFAPADTRRAPKRVRHSTGHHLRPRHAAHRRGIERRELHALPRHAVKMRRLLLHRAEGPDVAVAEVVNEVDDDVGPRSRPRMTKPEWRMRKRRARRGAWSQLGYWLYCGSTVRFWMSVFPYLSNGSFPMNRSSLEFFELGQ